MGDLNKGEKPKMSIKNSQQKPLLLDKHRHFKHTFSFGYSLFFSLKIASPLLLHVLLLFILLSIFLLRTYCHHIVGKMLVPLDNFLILFMMNIDFGGLKHCPGQLFSNKCNCAKQVGWINVEVARDVATFGLPPNFFFKKILLYICMY